MQSVLTFAVVLIYGVYLSTASTNQDLSFDVKFCTPTIDLAVGDKLNIRDFIVDRTTPSTPIDWSKVMLYYPDNGTWHLDQFQAGTVVSLDSSETKSFVGGVASYKLFVQGQGKDESTCNIRVWASLSQLVDILKDNMCGSARGPVTSVPNPNPTAPVEDFSSGQVLRFCMYSITLTIGDVFNIRDTVVSALSPSKRIDWTKVSFYYSDRETWHIHEFSRGKPFLIRESDFGKGNRGPDQYLVSMSDVRTTDHSMIIKLSRNASESQDASLPANTQCGFMRDANPLSLNARPYPAIVTVVFDYKGPAKLSLAFYVADLLGIVPQWVQDCPHTVSGTDCVQFVDTVVGRDRPNPKIWADHFLSFVNLPSNNDTRASEWATFSKANITGYSSLDNSQPLEYDIQKPHTDKYTTGALIAIFLVVLFTIIIIAVVGGYRYHKLQNQRI